MATYAAMVDRMDQNIGRVLAALADLGIENDTVIFFLSDNGGCPEEPGGRDPTQQPGIASTYTAVGPAWGWAQNTPFRRYKMRRRSAGLQMNEEFSEHTAIWPASLGSGVYTDLLGRRVASAMRRRIP